MSVEVAALDPKIIETLSGISTATLTTVLLKKGLRNVWMRGTRPLKPGQPRLVGRAFTLRFVPAREDRRRRPPGPTRSPPAAPSRRCRRASSWWRTPWAAPMPASSATSSAPGWRSGRWRR
ncbi:RraA family protein [Teichococcus aestuarii]|uniref:hypothetical protein n=1 Tax=Teichococcus aestuarii TaxID=568898 RepID=UPI00362287D2